MQLTIDSATLQEALRVITRLAPPAMGTVTLQSDGKKAWMHSYGELNQCSFLLPGKVAGSATFAIAIDSIRDATKGRDEIELAYKNTILNIRSGKYRAELTTSDAISVEDASTENETVTKVKIDPDQASWLKSAVGGVALKPTALLSTFMPIGVKLTDKGAFVACFDSNHMAFLRSKEIKGDAEFVIPSDALQGVLEVFGQTAFTMSISQSAVIITNKLAKVRLSIPHLDENGPTFSDVIGKSKEAIKMKGNALVLDKAAVVQFLDNSKAVAVKERGEVLVESEKGVAKFKVTTVSGTVKTSIKATINKSVTFLIDYEYLDEMVRKSGDSLEFIVVQNAFLLSNTAKATIICAFNQG